MKYRSIVTAGVSVFAFALACVPAAAQVTFQRFPLENGFINDMSADGSVVVGMFVVQPKNHAGLALDERRWRGGDRR
jgi:hypothetical protein